MLLIKLLKRAGVQFDIAVLLLVVYFTAINLTFIDVAANNKFVLALMVVHNLYLCRSVFTIKKAYTPHSHQPA